MCCLELYYLVINTMQYNYTQYLNECSVNGLKMTALGRDMLPQ